MASLREAELTFSPVAALMRAERTSSERSASGARYSVAEEEEASTSGMAGLGPDRTLESGAVPLLPEGAEPDALAAELSSDWPLEPAAF